MVDGVERSVTPPAPQKSMQKQIPQNKNSTKAKKKPGNMPVSTLFACAANLHPLFAGAVFARGGLGTSMEKIDLAHQYGTA